MVYWMYSTTWRASSIVRITSDCARGALVAVDIANASGKTEPAKTADPERTRGAIGVLQRAVNGSAPMLLILVIAALVNCIEQWLRTTAETLIRKSAECAGSASDALTAPAIISAMKRRAGKEHANERYNMANLLSEREQSPTACKLRIGGQRGHRDISSVGCSWRDLMPLFNGQQVGKLRRGKIKLRLGFAHGIWFSPWMRLLY